MQGQTDLLKLCTIQCTACISYYQNIILILTRFFIEKEMAKRGACQRRRLAGDDLCRGGAQSEAFVPFVPFVPFVGFGGSGQKNGRTSDLSRPYG